MSRNFGHSVTNYNVGDLGGHRPRLDYDISGVDQAEKEWCNRRHVVIEDFVAGAEQ
jgi:hypothetical protein